MLSENPFGQARIGRCLGNFWVIACLALTCLAEAETIAKFTLKERFGVSHPDQPAEFSYSGGKLSAANARMVGPGGEEVAYQQLSSGNILIRTALPASRISTVYHASQVDPKKGTIVIGLNMLSSAEPVTGDVVRCEGSNLPGGLREGVNYFLKRTPEGAYQLSRQKDLSDTVDILSSRDLIVRRQGWIVDPDDPHRTLYARAHSYRTGDPIRLKSSGTLPEPLLQDRLYFVIKLTDATFRLGSSRTDALAGHAINLTTLGTGVFETTVEWTWTLVTGRSTSALAAEAVRLSDQGTSYEVTNGLTGVRVVKPAGNPNPLNEAPIQGVRLADGSWVATGPNHLYESYSQKLASFVQAYSLAVIESGPLLVRLEATYALKRPEYTYGSGHEIAGADPRAHSVTLAGNLYYWNGSTSMQFRANGGKLPCGLAENKLYWPLTRTYDQASNRTTFTLSAPKAELAWILRVRRPENRTRKKP